MATTSYPDLPEAVRQLEQEIGLEPGFLETLLNEPNDWSFVVKVHALAEAALTFVITEALGRPVLRDVIGNINMGDTRAGKLVIAHKLGLIGETSLAFLRTIGTMRNRFVHGVSHINLRIEEYAETMKPADANNFWIALAGGFSSDPAMMIALPGTPGSSIPILSFARQNPKMMFFWQR